MIVAEGFKTVCRWSFGCGLPLMAQKMQTIFTR
jgi:hypothetical protein